MAAFDVNAPHDIGGIPAVATTFSIEHKDLTEWELRTVSFVFFFGIFLHFWLPLCHACAYDNLHALFYVLSSLLSALLTKSNQHQRVHTHTHISLTNLHNIT
jgi:hypothetical protein